MSVIKMKIVPLMIATIFIYYLLLTLEEYQRENLLNRIEMQKLIAINLEDFLEIIGTKLFLNFPHNEIEGNIPTLHCG